MDFKTFHFNILTFFLSFFTGSSWSGDALRIALMFPFQLNFPEKVKGEKKYEKHLLKC